MRVAVQKLPGVESVNVSLERASTDIQLRPGNSITLEQLRRIIKNNGFTSKEATVTVVGKLIERGGQPALDVTGTNTVMLIIEDRNSQRLTNRFKTAYVRKPAGVVRLTGTVDSLRFVIGFRCKRFPTHKRERWRSFRIPGDARRPADRRSRTGGGRTARGRARREGARTDCP